MNDDDYLGITADERSFYTKKQIGNIYDSLQKYTQDSEPKYFEENDNEVEVNNKRKEIIKAFSFFDKDKNGLINAAEFRKILTDMCDINPDELDELIDRSDIDGDGFINYVELAYLLIK